MTDIIRRSNAVKPCPPAERLHQLFTYEPEVGILLWRHRPESEFSNSLQWKAWNGRLAGKVAGSAGKDYRVIGIGESGFLAHRLIWTMHNGQIPEGLLIDHKDGNGFNNRLDNLRLATGSVNQQNLKPGARSSTGVRGVYYSKRLRCYVASYRENGKLVHLGTFSDLRKAETAASTARLKMGYTERHVGR